MFAAYRKSILWKCMLVWLMSTLVALGSYSCTRDDDAEAFLAVPGEVKPYWGNHPLPAGKQHLQVLCIGNSYCGNATRFVSKILKDAGVADSAYSINMLDHSGASLEHWWTVTAGADSVQLLLRGGHEMEVDKGSMTEILNQEWDVIVLQQNSSNAVDYSTFNPWLRLLIDHIRSHCPNPNETLAWLAVWAYSQNYGDKMASDKRWQKINQAVRKMMLMEGIDVVIPAGTAIQNARHTSLNDENELTKDGTHLDPGVGCYIASCAWVQTICAAPFRISVEGTSSSVAAPDVVDLCQRCALAAVHSPFSITEVEGGE